MKWIFFRKKANKPVDHKCFRCLGLFDRELTNGICPHCNANTNYSSIKSTAGFFLLVCRKCEKVIIGEYWLPYCSGCRCGEKLEFLDEHHNEYLDTRWKCLNCGFITDYYPEKLDCSHQEICRHCNSNMLPYIDGLYLDNIRRCPNGHEYDNSRYGANCPICSKLDCSHQEIFRHCNSNMLPYIDGPLFDHIPRCPNGHEYDPQYDASCPICARHENVTVRGYLVSNYNSWGLKLGSNLIGTSSSCNIVLHGSDVSGEHACIRICTNSNNDNEIIVTIIDNGSSYGTFVNENYIGFNSYTCNNGDKIRLGSTELQLVLFNDADGGIEEKYSHMSF